MVLTTKTEPELIKEQPSGKPEKRIKLKPVNKVKIEVRDI